MRAGRTDVQQFWDRATTMMAVGAAVVIVVGLVLGLTVVRVIADVIAVALAATVAGRAVTARLHHEGRPIMRDLL